MTPPPSYSTLSVHPPQAHGDLVLPAYTLSTALSHEPSQDELAERRQTNEPRGPVVEQQPPLAQPPWYDAVHPRQPRVQHRASPQQIERETLRQIRQGSRRLRRIQERPRYAHSALDTDLTLQDERMFDLVHSAQEEGWRPDGATIATHTNPFDAQREQVGMISPSERITATTRARRSEAEDLMGGVRDTGH